MKRKSSKWSIQISRSLSIFLKEFCKRNGYTMSGFTEGAILNRISGSHER